MAFLPLEFPQPILFGTLLVLTILTSTWKVNLLVGAQSTSTLSLSYAADLMALLLLGPHHAMVVAAAGAWAQCVVNVRRPYPAYRTIFSVAAEIITMQATGWVYLTFGGSLTGAAPRYALKTAGVRDRNLLRCEHRARGDRDRALHAAKCVDDVVHQFSVERTQLHGGGRGRRRRGGLVARGSYWPAVLLIAPVYLTYRTYRIFLSRIEDEQRHTEETRKLHEDALEALLHATAAERALAEEKERLAVTLRSIADGVITTDLEGSVLLMNSAAERLTGWTQADVHRSTASTVFPIFDRTTRRRYEHAIPI